MSLALIRHLPTAYNKKGLVQGSLDIELAPIDDAQDEQIRANKALLNLTKWDAIYTSNLKRTIQTADAYGIKGKKDILLNEFNFGRLEGESVEFMKKELGGFWEIDLFQTEQKII